MNWLSFGLRTE